MYGLTGSPKVHMLLGRHPEGKASFGTRCQKATIFASLYCLLYKAGLLQPWCRLESRQDVTGWASAHSKQHRDMLESWPQGEGIGEQSANTSYPRVLVKTEVDIPPSRTAPRQCPVCTGRIGFRHTQRVCLLSVLLNYPWRSPYESEHGILRKFPHRAAGGSSGLAV